MKPIVKWLLTTTLIACSLGLYGYLTLNSEVTNNRNTAKPLSIQQSQQTLHNGLLLWRENQYIEAADILSALAASQLDQKIKPLVDFYQFYTQAYVTNNNLELVTNLQKPLPRCQQQILFVTPNIDSLVQAEHFRLKFKQDARLQSLPICVHETIWFEPAKLHCDPSWQNSGRLGCDFLSLATQLKEIPFTHLVIFAHHGKANVHNGIMFLDREDTYDVFVHELAHFAGFIDEYPLSQGLAQRVCKGVAAPNMVFKQAQDLHVDKQYWQTLGISKSVQLTEARTCDNHTTQAYKASNRLTFMEYHDTAYIPESYLAAWQKQLRRTPTLPSAHINFAQLFEAKNYADESLFWRAQYAQYFRQGQTEEHKL